jgi:hypothetical protein
MVMNGMTQTAENEDTALAVWVKQVGLEKTFEQFSVDVTVAFHTVAKLRASTRVTADVSNNLPCDPLAELWPPMRVKE